MNEQAIDQMLASLETPLSPAEQARLRQFGAACEAQQIWIAGHRVRGGRLHIHVADDQHQAELDISELDPNTRALRAGEPLDWEALGLPEGAPTETPR